MVAKQRVLVAGATGYLGRFIVKELNWQGYWVRALIRNSRKIAPVRRYANECLIWPENPA
ncbi:MAG: NmrA family NAD(P)-binding protein [Desulfobacterales bacterium]|nr:MAG: NmrA family NAD(P)-binding protein [Desulfobacterales bacterium]UCD91046.1 MAG: NmrA family NAD(P)-binding protein [Desulfobacterales bacterium]